MADRSRKMRFSAVALVVATGMAGCGGSNSSSSVQSPGAPEKTGTRILETGAALIQDKPPVEALNAYLDGFHFYSGRPQAQMEAHHYCSILSDELIQCVIFDGNVKNAKLMGVEYIVSERMFRTLAPEEKRLWHSHVHEVKSGQLIAPGIPQVAEHALMQKLIGTYGKTWHTWHTDLGKDLPVGVPQLMMGFTADGQASADMVDARDQRFGISSSAKRKDRESIVAPPVAEGADDWQTGKPALQIADPLGAARAGHSGAGDPAQASRPRQ
ncbi:OBAP family protein [Variovorax sp. J22R24]|uniref:OBAP family protein n=1 Tax=Variovorax gracilis TaxID=3053502 RepID=UPI0025763143|nr:OBAP family protein [Variovorax sp. J22R24]MDM0110408.1 OBAP family protein [Variovorax sp. J22R24]